MNDLVDEFNKAIDKNITYQGPMIKNTLATMADTTNFKKKDASGNNDNGLYAAREAYKTHGGPPWKAATAAQLTKLVSAGTSPLAASLAQPFELGGAFALPD